MDQASCQTHLLPNRWTMSLTAVLLLLSVPIVICMPLTSDTVLYDLQARLVLEGGRLYEDILEPNLPGIVWVHLLIRTFAGWSNEAIRVADLLIMTAAVWLLASICRNRAHETELPLRRNMNSYRRSWLLVLVSAMFYLSRNEWCHCQRDSWMLLPVAAALTLRLSVDSLRAGSRGVSLLRASLFLEGCLWGIAFWIKPHVAFSVIPLMLVQFFCASGRRIEVVREWSWVIAGGAAAGLPGVEWMVSSGAWSPFVDMQLNWNPEYLAAGRDRRSWSRVGMMLVRFHPWWLIHVVAIPLSIEQIVSTIRMSARRNAGLGHDRFADGWMGHDDTSRTPEMASTRDRTTPLSWPLASVVDGERQSERVNSAASHPDLHERSIASVAVPQRPVEALLLPARGQRKSAFKNTMCRCPMNAPSLTASTVLAVVYLSWLLQASVLQHAMDYIHVPPVLLGMSFLASRPWSLSLTVRRAALASFMVCGILASHQLQPDKQKLWGRCVREGSSWSLYELTSCGRFPDWRHLQDVLEFLTKQQPATGDVTCFNVHCIHVYAALNLLPSTRYAGISSLLELFPSRRQQILQSLHRSGHRFIVVDTSETPAEDGQYPWNQPVVFSAGSFRVLRPQTDTQSHGDSAGSAVAVRKYLVATDNTH